MSHKRKISGNQNADIQSMLKGRVSNLHIINQRKFINDGSAEQRQRT